ncbi:MAG: TlpA family protein disulfide reductase [Bacteroidetes bacterium]|nr:TlpA family protein disulfide reductase [Bacteroidota bacterium]
MKKSIFIIALVSIHFLCPSQNVTIKGIAKTYEYKEIGVWISNDYISNTQKQLTYSNIDSVGNFLLEFNSKEIQYITLKIDKHISSLYVEPNATYEVMVMPPDSTTYQNPNLEHDVKLSIKLKSKTEINSLTMDYDKRFDDFLTVDYKAFVSRVPQPKIDSFKTAMHGYYSTVKNNYFNAYIIYTIAALEEKTKASEKKLFASYLSGKPILYDNPEYMNFFNAFFKQKLNNFSLSKLGSPLIFQIDDRGSYIGAMEVLKRDVFLQNDTLRELVLLKGLYESYYDGTFKRTSVVPVIQQIVSESKIEEHIRIAQNILNSFSKLKAGSVAPFFELPDKAGLTHSLDEVRAKKYVYVIFYDATCTSCLEQMKVIPSLKKTYGERIQFVSISTDKTNAELKNFSLKNPKYDWLFLYDNTNGQLKNNYEIRSLPAYFLINPDGKFIQVPAESPDGDIDRVFYDLTKPKGQIHGVGDKKNH